MKSPERWLDAVSQAGHGVEEELSLSIQERAEEIILMGLRLPQLGVNLSHLEPSVMLYLNDLWADGRIERLVAQGMLITTQAQLRPTRQGQLLLNSIIEKLLN